MSLLNKIAVAGCMGKMGRLVVQEVMQDASLSLAAASVRKNTPFENQDIGEVLFKNPIGIQATSDPQTLFVNADCVIDFSHHDALEQHLQAAEKFEKPFVVAVTGLGEQHKKYMKDAAARIPLLYAANTSLGINLLLNVVERAAKALPQDFDLDICEAHHRHKKDVPSGTSLALGQAIRAGRENEALEDCILSFGAKNERPSSTIAYSVMRAGGYAGDHSVIFSSQGEMIELKHRSFNRQIYAQGAVRAAKWLVQQSPGLYSMKDVLGL